MKQFKPEMRRTTYRAISLLQKLNLDQGLKKVVAGKLKFSTKVKVFKILKVASWTFRFLLLGLLFGQSDANFRNESY